MKRTVSKLVIFLIFISLLLSGCSKKNQVVTQPKLLKPVNESEKTEKVTYRDVYKTKTYLAQMVPYIEELSFDMDGVFDKFHVAYGEKVKKGQKLASQSDEKFEEELEQLKKSYEETQNNYNDEKELSEVDLKIVVAKLELEEKKLKKADAGSKEEIQYNIDKLKLDRQNIQDSTKLEYSKCQKLLSIYNEKIKALEKKMATNSIFAPFDGVVLYTYNIEKESPVSRGNAILKIADTNHPSIQCSDILKYMVDYADKYYGLFHGKEYELTLIETKNLKQSSNSAQGAKEGCRFALKNKEDKLEIGDSGLLCLLYDYRENVLAIRSNALYTESHGETYVYRAKDGNKEKIYVEVGVRTDVYTEITKGLEEGDVVLYE